MHYARKLKYGDVHYTKATPWGVKEKFIEDLPLQDLSKCVIWPFGKAKSGYGVLTINKKDWSAHRRVAFLYHGEPPAKNMHAAHKCGVRDCVNPEHIYWATPAQNASDKLKHGTDHRGENHGQSQLTESQVKEIYRLKGIVSQGTLSQRYGVSQPTISDIHTGRTWGWLTGDAP
jgi:hypothetical protein